MPQTLDGNLSGWPWRQYSRGSNTRETTRMPSNPSSDQTSRSVFKPSGTSAESASGPAESDRHDGVSELRREVANLKDTVARLASQAGGEAAKTVRNVT